MGTVVGGRGQVTLEKELREALGIGPGWRVLQRQVGDRIELRFLPPRHRRSLRGALADPQGPRFATQEALQEATEAAWGAAVQEKQEREEPEGDAEPERDRKPEGAACR